MTHAGEWLHKAGHKFSDEELEPEKKKLKQTLDGGQRFHCISEKELDSLVVAKPPVNTEYSTKWAVRNFNDWKLQKNATHSSESKAVRFSGSAKLQLYADDILLYKPIKDDNDVCDLQMDIDTICDWVQHSGLTLNTTKTQLLVISRL